MMFIGLHMLQAFLFWSRLSSAFLVSLWVSAVPNSVILATQAEERADSSSAFPKQIEYFEKKIQPIFREHCFECHSHEAERIKANLVLDSHAGILKGSENGPVLVAGHPEKSILIRAIQHTDPDLQMPPKEKLREAEIQRLIGWVQDGAKGPATGKEISPSRDNVPLFSEADRKWWAFQPLTQPAIPKVEDGGWSRNPIDRFIFQKFIAEGLKPAPEATREELIRRVSFGLIGLPPTPEELDAFLADARPGAWQRLIERLLSSKHYGEKWGRHWLDLVRYAESDGFRADDYRPTAWRYRDYVIESFNEDKPYDRFVMEQLAGDEIDPYNPEAQVATGYLRLGIYEWNQRDARSHWRDIVNEMTDVTGDVFLGLGMGCARCHDHKFDPILQEDYFRLRAFFTPIYWTIDDKVALRSERKRYEERMAVWKEKTAELREEIEAVKQPYKEKAEAAAVGKFPKDIQAMYWKPEEEREPYEQQMHYLVYRQVLVEWGRLNIKDDDKKRLEELQYELAEFDRFKPEPLPEAMTVRDVAAKAPPARIPGNRRTGEIPPGFPTLLEPEPPEIEPIPAAPNSTGRRTALARWLTQPDNPLSVRVIVNRIWKYHFGEGLVPTPSDFGRLGEPPSHPELLDWLAVRFVEEGWSFKEMHRLILNSATYRQSALRDMPDVAKRKDPENLLLWRFRAGRLDAEQIRDAMLAVSGELNLQAGGPSVDGDKPRRSVYVRIKRNTPDPFLNAFDGVSGLDSVAERNVTTTALQSLLMMNGEWVLQRARAMAQRLVAGEGSEHPQKTIESAYRLAFGREPTGQELAQALDFLKEQEKRAAEPPDLRPDPVVAKLQSREGLAARFEPGSEQERLMLPPSRSLPKGDFTVETFFILDSLYSDASVRTLVSQWDNQKDHPGWSFGVTSEQSAYEPRNLILQMTGDTSRGDEGYEVIASNLRPELGKLYYAAVVYRSGEAGDAGTVFYLKNLSRPDPNTPLQAAYAAHQRNRYFGSPSPLVIGGRDNEPKHLWHGVMDDVRLTGRALERKELLLYDEEPFPETVGFWRFNDPPGFYRDASRYNRHLRAFGDMPTGPSEAAQVALADFCHVLLNSNEFLYLN